MKNLILILALCVGQFAFAQETPQKIVINAQSICLNVSGEVLWAIADNQLKAYQLPDYKLIRNIDISFLDNISILKAHPDEEDILFMGNKTGDIAIYNTKTERMEEKLISIEDETPKYYLIRKLEYFNNRLNVHHYNGAYVIWDLKFNKVLKKDKLSRFHGLTQNGELIQGDKWDNECGPKSFKIESASGSQIFEGHSLCVSGVKALPNQKLLSHAETDGIFIWDRQGNILQKHKPLPYGYYKLELNPDGKGAFFVDNNFNITNYNWENEAHEIMHSFDQKEDKLYQLLVVEKQRDLIVRSDKGLFILNY